MYKRQGSKELKLFTEVPEYQKRLFARVLSLPSVIDTCRELGFEGKNLIAMQLSLIHISAM